MAVTPAYVFGESGQATVTAGGTTAPASGTVESWTISSSTLPSVTTGKNICACADILTANSTETVWITNISGATATVTRGQEGTSTVAHTTPFTIQNVNTVGALAQRLDWVNVCQYPYLADPSGTNDATTAIQNAINFVGAAGGGTVYFPAGSYSISSPLTIDSNYVTLQGAGYGFSTQIVCNFQAAGSPNGIIVAGATAVRNYINIIGLCIQGNKNPFGSHGLIYRVEVGTIRDVIVQFPTGDGIHMSPNDFSTSVDTNTLDNVYVQFPGGHGVSAASVADSEWFGVHIDGGALRTAPNYSNTTLYTTGNSVNSGSNLYQCIATTTGNAPPNASFWNPVSSLYGGATLYASGTTYTLGEQVFSGSLGYLYTCQVASTLGNAPTGTTASNTQWTYSSGLDGFHMTSGLIKLYGCHAFTNVNYGLQQVGAKGLQIHGGEYESNNLAGIYLNNTVRATVQGPALYCDPNPTIPAQNVLIGSASTQISLSQLEMHQGSTTRSVPIGVEIQGTSTAVGIGGSIFGDIGMTTAIQVDSGQNAANSTFFNNVIDIASGGTAIAMGSSNNCVVTGNRLISTGIIAETGTADFNTFTNNDVTAHGAGGIVTVGTHSAIRGNPGVNPAGFLSGAPGVAGSGVSVTNSTGYDAMIIVKVSAAGTSTAITVGGQATGIASATANTTLAPVRVPVAQTISIAYANAPTWQWWGD